MPALQATFTSRETLFLWTESRDVRASLSSELPGLLERMPAGPETLVLVSGATRRRTRVVGYSVPVQSIAPRLAMVSQSAWLSDSLRGWVHATKLAHELAAAGRVVPSVHEGRARWRALLVRDEDIERFERIATQIPWNAACEPTTQTGKIAVRPKILTVRSFIDAVVDHIYRTNSYPGTTRGWLLEFADALRGASNEFNPRSAKAQGIPGQLAAWSRNVETEALRTSFAVTTPREGSDLFRVDLRVHPPGRSEDWVPISDAWAAGEYLEIDGEVYAHPAFEALRSLARATRLAPQLAPCLDCDEPLSLEFTPTEAWNFLSNSAVTLRAAGFSVDLPAEFEQTGTRRLRARIRFLSANDGDLGATLKFRWEVTLGEEILQGDDLASLLAQGRPIVLYRGDWVLLDPRDLERIPSNLDERGELPAAEALRALLTGMWNGVPVVADNRLEVLMDALRSPPPEPIPANFRGQLRHYQMDGYSWLSTLERLGLGACLADDMGLGKTIQVIAHLLRRTNAGAGPHLVICPTSVLGNWEREISKFAPTLSVIRHHGLNRDLAAVESADVLLTTYGLLVRDIDDLTAVQWDVIALDEAQAIKNPDSRRAKCARELVGHHRIAMSGTPVENRLDELWSLMSFLVPGYLGSRGSFKRNIAVPIERFGDSDVAEQLKRGVSPFLMRRVKTDPSIAPELPEKLERTEHCSMTAEQVALYRQVSEEFLQTIREAEDSSRRGQVLAMLTALKQVCNHPAHYLKESGPLEGRSGKMERCIEIVQRVASSGESTILFTQYREMGLRLQRHLSQLLATEIPFLSGSTPAAQREALVRDFQSPDGPPVLLISLRAGGTGLNLTRATHVIHYDRWWNPAVEDQATDRAYRIGQTRNVFVHKMLCSGTLEEKIAQRLDEKRALAEAVVTSGEGWITELSDADLRHLVALGDDFLMGDG